VTPEKVADNLAAIRDRVAAACLSAGRAPDEVQLVAVTKRIALPLVVAVCRAGQLDLGENRLPEALDRQSDLTAALVKAGLPSENIRWHFIGHIQSRKAVQAVGGFCLLHGVDSLKLAEKLSRQCVAAGVKQPILLEVNISGEEQKDGLPPDQTLDTAGRCLELPGLQLEGLMGMARYRADEKELHACFGGLNKLAQEARRQLGAALPQLSMGMSGDFEAAIAEGATLVRVGSAIFGPRE
jgi:pyridoxal phosphate enzyme (YggS family)